VIYFIDVEGGQATLVVTPAHESLLIDAGFGGDGVGSHVSDYHLARDANRIIAATRDARVKRVDDLLITHFHPDHDGGVAELAQLLPIRAYIDHGDLSPEAARDDTATKEAFDAYASARIGHRHLEPEVGQRLPLRGLDVTVVSSGGRIVSVPLPRAGASNTVCPAQTRLPLDPYENPRSTGIVLRYGRFRFLDVGDLTGKPCLRWHVPGA
jgi:competence protein ComEC